MEGLPAGGRKQWKVRAWEELYLASALNGVGEPICCQLEMLSKALILSMHH